MGSTASNSAVGTLVERVSGFVMLLHLPDGHGALAVQGRWSRRWRPCPALRLSLTWDQGKEMANHVASPGPVDIYFADPHGQRG